MEVGGDVFKFCVRFPEVEDDKTERCNIIISVIGAGMGVNEGYVQ